MKKIVKALSVLLLASTGNAAAGELVTGETIKLHSGTTVTVDALECPGGVYASHESSSKLITKHQETRGFHNYLEKQNINPYTLPDKKYNHLYANWQCSTKKAVVGGLLASALTVNIISICTANVFVRFAGVGLQAASMAVNLAPCKDREDEMDRRRIKALERQFKKETCHALEEKEAECK